MEFAMFTIRPARRCAMTVAAATAGLTLLTAPAACAAQGNGTAATLRPAAQAAASAPARCGATARTCWVAVNVATLWVKPWYPRPVDKPALTNPADPRRWIASMTQAQKSWLVGRLESQALYGTKVTIIGHHGAAWTKVAVPGQPTNRDGRGYPGWVPTRQLTSTRPPTAGTYAVVRWRTAWLWDHWAANGVYGSKVMEVSFNTQLPVVHATSSYAEVALTGGRHLALSARVYVLHRSGTGWSPTRAKVVAAAKRFLGLPYLWAGVSGLGYDCSGFTYSAYRAFGVTLPRDADRQAAHGTPVAFSKLLPGDLVFFRSGTSGPIIHVGMYVGNGNMIDAPNTSAVIRIEPVATFGNYAGARRYLSH
jgi:gamma-D-glutamyl-L-lysine dipeptidyl-peptidase